MQKPEDQPFSFRDFALNALAFVFVATVGTAAGFLLGEFIVMMVENMPRRQ